MMHGMTSVRVAGWIGAGAVALLGAAGVLSMAGCNIVAPAYYIIHGPEKVAAQHEPLAETECAPADRHRHNEPGEHGRHPHRWGSSMARTDRPDHQNRYRHEQRAGGDPPGAQPSVPPE